MKKRITLAVLTAAFYVAMPAFAQGNGNHGTGGNHGDGNNGNHNGHGNNSNHSGHDDDGNSAGHRNDGPHGFKHHNDMSNPGDVSAVSGAITSATASLKSGSMVTSNGNVIPAPAQARTYALLAGDPTIATQAADFSAALSTAGPAANAFVPELVRGFSTLRSNPAQLPSVVALYTSFTKSASSEFISNPPAEFLAMHAVLAQLVAAPVSGRKYTLK
jgi:hypothetical protein